VAEAAREAPGVDTTSPEEELIAALRTAADAVRELPASLDTALAVLGEAVRKAAGPHPPAPSPNRAHRAERDLG